MIRCDSGADGIVRIEEGLSPHIARVPDPKSGDTCTYLKDIETIGRQAFESGRSYAELDAAWAV